MHATCAECKNSPLMPISYERNFHHHAPNNTDVATMPGGLSVRDFLQRYARTPGTIDEQAGDKQCSEEDGARQPDGHRLEHLELEIACHEGTPQKRGRCFVSLVLRRGGCHGDVWLNRCSEILAISPLIPAFSLREKEKGWTSFRNGYLATHPYCPANSCNNRICAGRISSPSAGVTRT